MIDPTQLPLRDIHLPDPISWWPPAVGWWILSGLLILLVFSVRWLFRYRHKKKYSSGNQAKLKLREIRIAYSEKEDISYLVREISSLMRRLSISLFPREETAGLVGNDWLSFLDRVMQDRPFSEGIGRILSEGPYRPQTEVEGEALLVLCEQWINQAIEYAKNNQGQSQKQGRETKLTND